jgi:predicted MarR family transcription regulator
MTFDVVLVTETSLEQTALDAKVTARYAALREELAVAEVRL